MAMNLTTIKNTNQETVIHFEAVDISSATITIADLAAPTQLRNSETPEVNIVRFLTTGEDTASITVVRDSKMIIACAPENAPFLDLPSIGVSDGINNSDDIVISNNVAKAVTGYIVLRKLKGWSTTVENATYGAYDDPTRVGASTTMSGSPDKV